MINIIPNHTKVINIHNAGSTNAKNIMRVGIQRNIITLNHEIDMIDIPMTMRLVSPNIVINTETEIMMIEIQGIVGIDKNRNTDWFYAFHEEWAKIEI